MAMHILLLVGPLTGVLSPALIVAIVPVWIDERGNLNGPLGDAQARRGLDKQKTGLQAGFAIRSPWALLIDKISKRPN